MNKEEMVQEVSLVLDKVMSRKARTIAYAVCLSACAVLVVLGIIDLDRANTWLWLAGTVLGIGSSGLALANRPKDPAAVPNVDVTHGPVQNKE